jgi:hypothetical protein
MFTAYADNDEPFRTAASSTPNGQVQHPQLETVKNALSPVHGPTNVSYNFAVNGSLCRSGRSAGNWSETNQR